MTTNRRPPRDLLVVDLDGTLVLGNSFHDFLLVSWKLGSTCLRIRMLGAFLIRTLSTRADKRWRMKQAVLRAFDRMEDSRRQRIVDRVVIEQANMFSTPVLREIARANESGVPVMLATAAPALYAAPLAKSLNIPICLATESASLELLGEAKAIAVQEWLAAAGTTSAAVHLTLVTDHPDDVPLMRMSSTVLIQAAPDRVAQIAELLEGSSVVVRHIDSVSEQNGGGFWIWFDDRPSGPHDRWELRTILSKHRYALAYVGAGRWTRIRPGERLDELVPRSECPTVPGMRQRLTTLTHRRVVRDRLGIFH